ncbi:TIGR02281 family clan AA aspartic protease [Pseudorhodoferax sp.]|uniref:retropepsin-like aspartic protease family protein n=1 Tax=Pseudorhodoferax sp. TaxID=1993553 RepID=UPI0039E6334F
MKRRPALAAALAAATLGWAGAARAQAVALTGVLGRRALLVVDGEGPRSLAVGERWRGVTLVSVQGDQAELDIGGRRASVRLGEAPASVGPAGGAQRIVLQADGRGHFTGQGRINAQLVQFMVDTGASTVALGAAEADRLGLAYREGQSVRLSTANGTVQGWAVRLATLRLGEAELHGVDAVVVPVAMPYVLLGNNVLGRFEMTRSQERMVLQQRY